MTDTANTSSITDVDISDELDAISKRLVAARTNAEALPEFPGQLPDNLGDAYTIQTASMARWPDEVGGWKVGMVPPEFRPQLAAERLAGPIFKSSIFTIESGASKTMPMYSGGFAAVEAEFMLEVAATIEPTARYFSDEELGELISAVYIGAEIASSPMALINKLGPCCVVSDFGNNAGLLVGPAVPDWRDRSPESMAVAVSVDGKVVGSANASAIEGGLLQVLRFLLALCADRGLALPKGTLISSGAVTGIHDVTEGSMAVVNFGELGSFDVTFESMRPKQ